MADNVRFHSKYHAAAHHTDASPLDPGSSLDPIASESYPFKGNFYLTGDVYAGYTTAIGGLSANSLSATNLVIGGTSFGLGTFLSYCTNTQNATAASTSYATVTAATIFGPSFPHSTGLTQQMKQLIPGTNVSIKESLTGIQINAAPIGIEGTLFTATTSLPTSSLPVTVTHTLTGIPEIVSLTLKCNTAAFPVSDPMPYLSGEEIEIQAFQYAGAASTVLSAAEWDELYSYSVASSGVTVTRNIDTTSTGSATTSAHEKLSLITKSGNRAVFTNEAELTGNFGLNIKLIKGGMNFQAPIDFNISIDTNDQSLFESSTTIGGSTSKYWRVRSDGIKSRHIAGTQILTDHLQNDSVTYDKLEKVSSVTAGSYTNSDVTVDGAGRVTSISSGTAAAASTVTETGGFSAMPDVYFNNPDGLEVPLSSDTARISPSGSFNNWSADSYDNIPNHTTTDRIGVYDPRIIPLPDGNKKVKIRAWGAGAGCNVHSPAAGTTDLQGVYTGGAGGYAEAIYVMDSHVTQLEIYIGKGGGTSNYGISGTTGTATATARPIPLSGVIPESNPITNLYYDQTHPPGCGGDTIVCVQGVSGNPVTILKAHGGGVNNLDNSTYSTLSAAPEYYEFLEVTAAAGGARSSTRVTKTTHYVPDSTTGTSVTGACTFFTDGFDTGFSNAWAAGSNSLSGLEHVLGIDVPASANIDNNKIIVDTIWITDRSTQTTILSAASGRAFDNFYTFSASGEFGNSVYTNILTCHPNSPSASDCFTVIPRQGSSAFGSNKAAYGAGGTVITVPLTGSFDDSNGRDGGVIVEIL